jgi:hypothetical protein
MPSASPGALSANPPDGPCPGTFLGLIRGESGLSKREARMPTRYGCERRYSSAGFRPWLHHADPARESSCGLRRIYLLFTPRISQSEEWHDINNIPYTGISAVLPPGFGPLPVSALAGGRGHHAVLPGEERAFSPLPIPRGIPVPLCDCCGLATDRDFLRGSWRASRQWRT